MVKCEIRFDNNPLGVYYSGQKVTGRVEITLLKKKNVEAIVLNISGRAKTKLSEYNHTQESYDWYIGKEQYIDAHTFLIGSFGGKRITLDPGIHTFHFACDLPPALPSSFESKHGFIRYLIKVTLERPWKFFQTHVVGFTVLKQVDLNLEEPNKRLPFKITTTKQLRSGFFSKKPFSLVLTLPHMGFVPGQIMPVSLNLHNESSTNVENLQINFKRIVTFKARITSKNKYLSQKVKTDYLCVKNYGKILGHSDKTILHDIRVPPMPPTSKESCSIIIIDYEIEVKAYFGFFQNKLKIKCPIIIGTVPIYSAVQFQSFLEGGILDTSRNNSNIIANSSENGSKTHCSSQLEELPSYQEASQRNWLTISYAVEHPINKSQCLPRYPFYTFDDKSLRV